MSESNERPPPLPARPSTNGEGLPTLRRGGVEPQPPPVPPRPAGFAAPRPPTHHFAVPLQQSRHVPSPWPNYGHAAPPPPPPTPGTMLTAGPPALPARPWVNPPSLPAALPTSAVHPLMPGPPQYPSAVSYAAPANSGTLRQAPGSNLPFQNPVPMSARLKSGLQDVERMLESLRVGQSSMPIPIAAKASPSYAAPSVQHAPPLKPTHRFPTSGVSACIRDPIVFPTTWYIHDDVPAFPVCSRCFEDHIRGSPFESEFKARVLNDGQPRWCRFSKPRVKNQLFKRAIVDDFLALLIGFMKLRSTIPDCKGVAGASGTEGVQWFRLKNKVIPGLIVCQACYEDEVQARHLVGHFEPSGVQPPNTQWACDMALDHIRREYAHRADVDDYPGFVREASRRLRMPVCEKMKLVVLPLRTWYAPVSGPRDALVCETCYHDNIVHTDEEHKWRRVGNVPTGYDTQVYCALGMFNIRIAFGRGKDAQDYSVFWHALHEIYRQPLCDPQGMKGANWYVLTSRPANFDICGGCYAGIAEPAGISQHFVRRTDVTSETTLMCDFGPGSPRFQAYMAKLLEAYYVRDVQPFESYVHKFANLPMCRRDVDFEHGTWYGWDDCTICPLCHYEFVRGTALAPQMPLQGVTLEATRMCEMYSPRMRRLYTEACAQLPPNVAGLLAASARRRAVYVQTMMVCRQMLIQQQIKALQSQTLGIQGSFYTNMGQMESITMPSPYEYSMAGVGHGFTTQHELTGAIYNQQSAEMARGATSAAANVGLLEQQWRLVE